MRHAGKGGVKHSVLVEMQNKKGFVGAMTVGLVLIVVFFVFFILANLPFFSSIAFIQEIAGLGIFLPIGIFLVLFPVEPRVAAVAGFGLIIFLVLSGVSII